MSPLTLNYPTLFLHSPAASMRFSLWDGKEWSQAATLLRELLLFATFLQRPATKAFTTGPWQIKGSHSSPNSAKESKSFLLLTGFCGKEAFSQHRRVLSEMGNVLHRHCHMSNDPTPSSG